MKFFLLIAAWAVVSYFLAPKLVKLDIGGKQSDNIYIKWLVLFLIPVIILMILALLGAVVIAGFSIIGVLLIVIPILIIVGFITGNITINGRR